MGAGVRWSEQRAELPCHTASGPRARRRSAASRSATTEAQNATTEKPHDGLTRQDLIYEAKLSLLTAGIRAQIEQPAAQSVTPEQIRAYVDANPQLLPERRKVRIVRASTRHKAAQAQKAIKQGSTWRSAAKKYASGTGNPRTVERGDYDPRTEQTIFESAPNVTVRYRTYVFRVTAILPPRPMPRDQQEAIAWETLSNQAQQRAIDAFTGAFQQKWRAQTSCCSRLPGEPRLWPTPSGSAKPLTQGIAPKTRIYAELRPAPLFR